MSLPDRGNGHLSSSSEERVRVRSRKMRSHPWNELTLEEEIPYLHPLPFAKGEAKTSGGER
jgi:hypothetical protein